MKNEPNINKLHTLFDKKIDEFGEKKDPVSLKKQEVNERYAETYINFVTEVISGITELNKSQDITIGCDLIGRFYIPSDNNYAKSSATLTEDGLTIILKFNLWTDKYRINREEGYDEELLNQMLQQAGITVKTDYGDEERIDASIKITYRRPKELVDTKTNDGEEQSLKKTIS